MEARDKIELGIFLCILVTAIVAVMSFRETKEWFENDLRPWVKIEKVEIYSYHDTIEIRSAISNIGKTPAYIKFRGKATIGDKIYETPPQVGITNLMPGEDMSVMFRVPIESYLAVLTGDEKLTLESNINYSRSKDSLDDYRPRSLREYKPIRQDVEIPKEGKIQGVGVWFIIDRERN